MPKILSLQLRDLYHLLTSHKFGRITCYEGERSRRGTSRKRLNTSYQRRFYQFTLPSRKSRGSGVHTFSTFVQSTIVLFSLPVSFKLRVMSPHRESKGEKGVGQVKKNKSCSDDFSYVSVNFTFGKQTPIRLFSALLFLYRRIFHKLVIFTLLQRNLHHNQFLT